MHTLRLPLHHLPMEKQDKENIEKDKNNNIINSTNPSKTNENEDLPPFEIKLDTQINPPPDADKITSIQFEKKVQIACESLNKYGQKLLPANLVLRNIFKKNSILALKGASPPKHNDLMSIIADHKLLTLAYKNLGSNKGATTSGPKDSADGMDLKRIQDISLALKKKTFKWSPFRRVWIPKPGKPIDPKTGLKPMRPLGVPDFSDKLVQEVIRMVLEAIYEPWFEIQNTNFGFRPGKSPHDAIKKIKSSTQGTTLAIEADIKGAYDNVQQPTLIRILEKRIQDKHFIKLLDEGLKCGLIDKGKYESTLLGTPQGGIASPILFNIYMHEFDLYIEQHIKTFTNLSKENQTKYLPKTNPRFLKLEKEVKKLKFKLNNTNNTTFPETKTELSKQLNLVLKEKMELNKTFKRPPTIKALRCSYVRYADDWIIFTNGNNSFTTNLKTTCNNWLKTELGLTLSPEKTLITDITSKPAKFLGFTIWRSPTGKDKVLNMTPEKYALQKGAARNSIIIKIGIDSTRLKSKFIMKRYCTQNLHLPREKPELSVLSLQEIIEHYNSVMLGLANYYYPIITYKSHINYWLYILYYSCLKTIATKTRLSIKQLSMKYGYIDKTINTTNFHQDQRIVIPYTQNNITKYAILLNYKETMARCWAIFKNSLTNQNNHYNLIETEFLNNYKRYWRTQFKLTTCCTICGSQENIQNHHIRHLKRKDAKNFNQVMAQLGRKQIPVCKPCHDLIHAGKYNGISLDDLHIEMAAKAENIIQPKYNITLKKLPQLGWNKYQAYVLDHNNKTIKCEYIAAQASLKGKKTIYPLKSTYITPHPREGDSKINNTN